jgi:UDP-N-acetylmuramoyl-tripeptide--D-alanyl-D-alanine ligase
MSTYTSNPIKQIFHETRRIVAKNWLKLIPTTQIAITGSQGKTNVSSLIKKILAKKRTVSTDLNLDTVYNVPITALQVKPWTKYSVFELGVDHIGEMDKHLEIVNPKIAFVTGISAVHTDKEHLGSLENLIVEKTKLVQALPKNGFAILNYDDINVRNMANKTQAQVLFYGSDPKKCTAYFLPQECEVNLDGLKFKIHDKKQIIPVDSNLIGLHHASNITAVYLLCKILNFPIDKFLKKLKEIKPLHGRMSVEEGPNKTVVLNDSLRANPTSMEMGLKTLPLIKYKDGKKIAVLAEMGELQNPKEEHSKIGKLISNLNIDAVICIGPNQKYVFDNIEKIKKYYAHDVCEAGQILKDIVRPGDLIYLKGSLLRHVERVLYILDGKKVTCHTVICDNYTNCSKCKNLAS